MGPEAWDQPLTLRLLLPVILFGVVLYALATAVLMFGWERLGRRRRQQEQMLRELRHLRPWAGVEGVLRKAALLHDLNALGAIPRDLDGFELSGADLRGIRLPGCSLRGANLTDADLQGADLQGADLFGGNLAGANLSMANLRGSSLRGCNLTDAGLIKADLAGANLHRSELVNANMQGATLKGVRLTLARFARPDPSAFQVVVHASVDDWIRARLDGEGRFREQERQGSLSLSDAG